MSRFHNLEDFRQRAKTRLPKIMFDFIDGAAGGENGSYNNYHCIERIRLLPRVLNNVVERDLTKPIFEEEFKLPFGIAPMGMCDLAWAGTDQAWPPPPLSIKFPSVSLLPHRLALSR